MIFMKRCIFNLEFLTLAALQKVALESSKLSSALLTLQLLLLANPGRLFKAKPEFSVAVQALALPKSSSKFS